MKIRTKYTKKENKKAKRGYDFFIQYFWEDKLILTTRIPYDTNGIYKIRIGDYYLNGNIYFKVMTYQPKTGLYKTRLFKKPIKRDVKSLLPKDEVISISRNNLEFDWVLKHEYYEYLFDYES